VATQIGRVRTKQSGVELQERVCEFNALDCPGREVLGESQISNLRFQIDQDPPRGDRDEFADGFQETMEGARGGKAARSKNCQDRGSSGGAVDGILNFARRRGAGSQKDAAIGAAIWLKAGTTTTAFSSVL